jgi:hypothetical protein
VRLYLQGINQSLLASMIVGYLQVYFIFVIPNLFFFLGQSFLLLLLITRKHSGWFYNSDFVVVCPKYG